MLEILSMPRVTVPGGVCVYMCEGGTPEEEVGPVFHLKPTQLTHYRVFSLAKYIFMDLESQYSTYGFGLHSYNQPVFSWLQMVIYLNGIIVVTSHIH
jgi:hypothetical protein